MLADIVAAHSTSINFILFFLVVYIKMLLIILYMKYIYTQWDKIIGCEGTGIKGHLFKKIQVLAGNGKQNSREITIIKFAHDFAYPIMAFVFSLILLYYVF